MGVVGDLAGTTDRPPRALSSLLRMRERHGDPFAIRVFGERLLIGGDPEFARQIFQSQAGVLRAGEANRRVLGWLFGEHSLMLLDAQEHLSHRRLLLPPLHGPRLERRAKAMRAVVEAQLDSWPIGEEVAALPWMRQLTLELIMTAVFGGEQTNLRPLRESLGALQPTSAARGGRSQVFHSALQNVRSLIDGYVSERRAGGSRGDDDVLSVLLEARREDGTPLSQAEVCDELLTLVVAGTETSASALAWALERLARAPEALARTAEEATEGGGPYTNAVIHETLRMRPPVPMSVLRFVDRPFRLGEHSIPPGTTVALSALLLHHRADIYPEPMAFCPERFLEHKPGTYTWIPFGGGVRRCLGASFALQEMRIVLSTLLSQTTLRATESAPEEMRNQGNTMVPAGGARVVLGPAS